MDKAREAAARWIEFNPWCVPFIRSNRFVRIFEGKRDVTDELFPIDHTANRHACRLANLKNAEAAERFRMPRRPYYHYDALTSRVLEFEVNPAPQQSPDRS